ncbi:hypothetical protein MF4836_00130 [Pseudomonas sp. MF4836]|nr:hypothetical protein MF4836_00130 [Pseudomonas sp. MF4836]
MPKLPVVRSRKSRVSGQPSQVAGALIPDNTQLFWRDEVRNRHQYVTIANAGAYMSMKTHPIDAYRVGLIPQRRGIEQQRHSYLMLRRTYSLI